MSGYGRRQAPRAATPGALVTPRQAKALDRFAAGNGFANGPALLADVAACGVAELGRKSRPVVQMFVSQAFERYGTPSVSEPIDDRPCPRCHGLGEQPNHEICPRCGGRGELSACWATRFGQSEAHDGKTCGHYA